MNGLNNNALIRYKVIDDCINNKSYWQKVLARKSYSRFYDGKRNLDEQENERDLPNKVVFRIVLLEKFNIEISDEQLDKDIKNLRSKFNAPIEYDNKQKGYYYNSKYSFQGENMNEDEINSIHFLYSLSKSSLKLSAFDNYNKTIESILKKLNKKFEFFDQTETDEISKYILKDDFLGNSGSQWIEIIYNAILKNRNILIKYKRYQNENENIHQVSPYLIKEYNHQWYLIGYSKLSKQIVTLALDRIKSIQEDKIIAIKENFNYKDYFKYSFGISNRIGSKPKKIKFIIDKKFENYFINYKIHHSQIIERVDSDLIVTLKCYITKELVSKFLSYGHNIKILSPEDLIEKVIQEFSLSLKNYEK